jgi:DNA-binding transcriptional regulator LsrR (DeoR family)
MPTLKTRNKPPGRNPKTPETAAMVKAARLYYEKHLSRQTIGKRMRMDPRDVSWLLEQAQEKQIVRIDILAPAEDKLKDEFQERYPHVLDVVIVQSDPVRTDRQYKDLLRKYALATADYYTRLCETTKTLHIGCCGGDTMLEVAMALPQNDNDKLYFHALALVGYAHFPKGVHHVLPAINAHILWSKAGRIQGKIDFATVGPYDTAKLGPGPEARAEVEAELERRAAYKPIREVIEAMDDLDIAFPGLGIVNPPPKSELKNRLGMTGILQNVVTPEQLIAEGAAGEMCGILFDAQGRSKDKWRFFLSAGHYSAHPGIEFFRDMAKKPDKRVIVAAGAFKVDALRAALRGQLFNALVTDSISAKELLR